MATDLPKIRTGPLSGQARQGTVCERLQRTEGRQYGKEIPGTTKESLEQLETGKRYYSGVARHINARNSVQIAYVKHGGLRSFLKRYNHHLSCIDNEHE